MKSNGRTKVMIAALAGVAVAALCGVSTLAASAAPQAGKMVTAATQVPALPTRVDNFRLVDHTSKSHELVYFKNSAAVVIMSHAPGANSAATLATFGKISGCL